MALVRIADFHPNYKDDIFGGNDIKGMDVYAGTTEEKIGTIYDVLVEESGRFRYLVVDTGFWIFGKKVLLPIGTSRIDYDARRVYAIGLVNKHQAEELPEYDELRPIDYDYEESVRGVYRNPAVMSNAKTNQAATDYDRDTYSYEREPYLYGLRDQDHQNLKLYEEKLIANKERHKTGEVAVGKRVETQTAKATVPIEKERVVVERTTPSTPQRVEPGSANFNEGEVMRMEVYEETPDIHKEAYVREEVNVRKEVDRDVVDAEEKLRREELDIKTDGKPVIDRDRKRQS